MATYSKFFIQDSANNLYLGNRKFYGVSKHNQAVFRMMFTKSLGAAREFSSCLEAEKFIDSMMPSETEEHELYFNFQTGIKFANLRVEEIKVTCDN